MLLLDFNSILKCIQSRILRNNILFILIYTFIEIIIVDIFRILKNLPEIFLPAFWFSESFEVPRNVSDQLLIVTNVLPIYIPYLWLVMTLAGSTMLVISIYLWVTRKNELFTILDPL